MKWEDFCNECAKLYIQELEQKLQQKENITREVREYVEKCPILGVNEVNSYCMDYDVRDDLLRILDKENKNENN